MISNFPIRWKSFYFFKPTKFTLSFLKILFFILLAYLYYGEITLSVSFAWFYFFFSIFFFQLQKLWYVLKAEVEWVVYQVRFIKCKKILFRAFYVENFFWKTGDDDRVVKTNRRIKTFYFNFFFLFLWSLKSPSKSWTERFCSQYFTRIWFLKTFSDLVLSRRKPYTQKFFFFF